MISVTFDLPRPLSVNGLYRNSATRGRCLSEAHTRWRKEAGLCVMAQRAKMETRRVSGRYVLEMIVGRASKGDLSNLLKAAEDLLVEMNVIDDDENAEEIHMRWGDVPGCRVIVSAA